MNFALTPEQDMLRTEAARFLDVSVDVRAQIALPNAHDPALWNGLRTMGLLGLSIEGTLLDVCIVLEQTGRTLLPGPCLGTMISSIVCIDALLKQSIAKGETIAGFADRPDTSADVVVTAEGETIKPARGSPIEQPDITRPINSVADVRAPRAALVMLAAETTGVAQGALDMAVAYAKERIQFDKPIGSFQAIKHKAADMARAVEAARLAYLYAAWDTDDASAATAKVLADEAAALCTAENIQIHGGIGVTWEHDAHLYYRRALANRARFGTAARHRDALAQSVL